MIFSVSINEERRQVIVTTGSRTIEAAYRKGAALRPKDWSGLDYYERIEYGPNRRFITRCLFHEWTLLEPESAPIDSLKSSVCLIAPANRVAHMNTQAINPAKNVPVYAHFKRGLFHGFFVGTVQDRTEGINTFITLSPEQRQQWVEADRSETELCAALIEGSRLALAPPAPAYTLAEWPHTTAPNCTSQGEQVGTDLFDDDEPGFTAIYIRYANGLRWPARSVRNGSESAAAIVAAWCARGNVSDYRTACVS